jgi:hypothetical protein
MNFNWRNNALFRRDFWLLIPIFASLIWSGYELHLITHHLISIITGCYIILFLSTLAFFYHRLAVWLIAYPYPFFIAITSYPVILGETSAFRWAVRSLIWGVLAVIILARSLYDLKHQKQDSINHSRNGKK